MIAILLSTFNGARHIGKLLDSLLDQDIPNYSIYIRDDGSNDETKQIIEEYKILNFNKIFILKDKYGNLGIRRSFEELMLFAEADYYCFCDQDDIWLRNKLSSLTNCIVNLEKETVVNTPILVFSDLSVIGHDGNVLVKNFYRKIGITNPKIKKKYYKGIISGCLMMFNRTAKQNYFNISYNGTKLHDYHMFISTTINGIVYFYNMSLVKYNIHEGNHFGLIRKKSPKQILLDLLKYFSNNKAYREIILKDYFEYVKIIKENELIKKNSDSIELFTPIEINMTNIFKRKKWYFNHFLSYERGVIAELINIFLI